jgi:hypothetical protein
MSFSDRADRLATLAKTLDRALDDCWDREAKAPKAAGYSAHADQQTLCDWVTIYGGTAGRDPAGTGG